MSDSTVAERVGGMQQETVGNCPGRDQGLCRR